jgi:hypothetical protein
VEFDDSDESDEGMDLADVVAAPVATNVIVIEGIDDALSAVAFEAIARDALYKSGARPLTIVHARGQMWVRMEGVAGGQRALGGLGSLWPELRLGYRADEDFEETAFTTDQWLRPDEMEGVEESTPPLETTSPSGASALDSAAAQESKGSSTRLSSSNEDLLMHSTVALST